MMGLPCFACYDAMLMACKCDFAAIKPTNSKCLKDVKS